jgi:hypothetical protein
MSTKNVISRYPPVFNVYQLIQTFALLGNEVFLKGQETVMCEQRGAPSFDPGQKLFASMTAFTSGNNGYLKLLNTPGSSINSITQPAS